MDFAKVFGQLMQTEAGIDRLFTENGITSTSGLAQALSFILLGNGPRLLTETFAVILQLFILFILSIAFTIIERFTNEWIVFFGFNQNATVLDYAFIYPHAQTYIKELVIEDYVVEALGMFSNLE